MEAFEILLETWISIVADQSLTTENNLFSLEYCKQSSIQIFNTYLQCHLSPPDGRRGAGGKDLNSQEIDSTEEDDTLKFKEQLQTIGNYTSIQTFTKIV